MAEVVRDSTARKIIIDHHMSQDDLGAIVFKDTNSESTGRLILQAIDALDVKLTSAMAIPLFAAIGTDTGWFRFQSVGEATFQAAGRLVAAGAKPHEVFGKLYEQNTLARILLQGHILSNVKSHVGGRLLTTAITQADLAKVGAEATDTEDVINRLLGVAGTEVALLFLELGPDETKVSLRSRTGVDVNAIAGEFGGGGHKAAAGVRYRGPLSEAEPAVIAAVSAALQGKS
jgi:phosphoesterase RecJ-like protein